MTPLEEVLLFAIAQKGDRYVFGTEVNPLHPQSAKWDCSEIVEIACAQAGVTPRMPDGAYYQWRHCLNHQLGISVERALRTRGALLFHGDGTGVGRDAITHVAWSLGNNTTFEARGSAWGVGTWAAPGRFQFAGLMPGVDYAPKPPPFPIPVPEELMRDERICVVPDPDPDGRQLISRDKNGLVLGKASLTSSVDLLAGRNGQLTDIEMQWFRSDGLTWSDVLALTVAADKTGINLPVGREFRIVIEHR